MRRENFHYCNLLNDVPLSFRLELWFCAHSKKKKKMHTGWLLNICTHATVVTVNSMRICIRFFFFRRTDLKKRSNLRGGAVSLDKSVRDFNRHYSQNSSSVPLTSRLISSLLRI